MPERMRTSETAPDDVSALLRAWTGGDQRALARLTPIVYDELHRLAHYYLKREASSRRLLGSTSKTDVRWQPQRTLPSKAGSRPT